MEERCPDSNFHTDFATRYYCVHEFNDEKEDSRKNSMLYTHVIAFTLYELETITKSFRSDYILGEGGFGTVYKGYIDENVWVGLKSLPIVVKVLNKEGIQGHREWLVGHYISTTRVRFFFFFFFV